MRCLFCKEPSHETKGVEHLIPESFGSKKLVLPKGLVCDSCNNYFARKIEGPLMSHPSMRNIRGYYQTPTKKGKLPSLLGYIAGTDIQVNLKLDENKRPFVRAEKASEQSVVDNYLNSEEFPPFIFYVDIDPPTQLMSRFLAMLALEAIALRFSYGKNQDAIIDEPSFDLIRNYARYGRGVTNWPYHRQVLYPMDALMKHPTTGEWVVAGFGHDIILTPHPETYVCFLLHGVEFTINAGGPSIHGYEEWLKKHDPLTRKGIHLVKKVENDKIRCYLEGDFNMKIGAEYDRKHWLGS